MQIVSKETMGDNLHAKAYFLEKNIFLRQYAWNVKAYFSKNIWKNISNLLSAVFDQSLFVLRFYSPVNPMGSSQAPSGYLTTLLLGRLRSLSS